MFGLSNDTLKEVLKVDPTPPYSLGAVMRDWGDRDINGWTGYTTDTYIKQWYFIDNVPLGHVEAQTIYPSQVPNSFHYHFARQTHGGFASIDEARAAFIVELKKWISRLMYGAECEVADLPGVDYPA